VVNGAREVWRGGATFAVISEVVSSPPSSCDIFASISMAAYDSMVPNSMSSPARSFWPLLPSSASFPGFDLENITVLIVDDAT
jgi:hypothetical protein